MKTFYVLAYDIISDSRRAKVAKIAESYGDRVNDSVFECVLDPKARARLVRRLQREVVPEEDQVRLYPLAAAQVAKIVTIGDMRPVNQPQSVVVI